MSICLPLTTLFDVPQNPTDRALAARYAPILRFDVREPFLPLAAGYTIFRESGESPSFRQGHKIDLAPSSGTRAELAIEYAIWWDWDIGHLYELEHIWVYVGRDDHVVRVEGSWHGESRLLAPLERVTSDGGEHPLVFSEPGKHAFAPTPAWFEARRKEFKRSETRDLAGVSGVLLAKYIREQVKPTPLKARLVHTYLSRYAFDPSGDFSLLFPITSELLVPWEALRAWMPGRVNAILDHLAQEIPPAAYRFLRIGHRGAPAHAPENTLLGFRTAAALGADMVEFDVQRTADGHTVVVHDPFLTDERGGVWPISHSTLAELRAVDLGQGECLPTFSEALQICREENLGAYIEIKDAGVIDEVITTLRTEEYTGHCILASFRPDWLAMVKDKEAQMMTAILFSAPSVDAVKLAQSVRANFVHPCWERFPNPSALLTPEWLARVRAADLGVICWHEERPAEIAVLRQRGVDAICSNAPELLLP